MPLGNGKFNNISDFDFNFNPTYLRINRNLSKDFIEGLIVRVQNKNNILNSDKNL